MKILRKKVVLLVLAAGFCSMVSAQSLKYSDGSDLIRKVSDNTYELKNSGILSYKIEKNKYWILDKDMQSPQQDNHIGYCTLVNGEYIYYSRSNNIVGAYNVSQGRYYMHSSQGSEILKSVSIAVLSKGVLLIETGADTPMRYTVDNGFDPVIIGFYLLNPYIIH